MAELKLFTFGQPRLERDGQPVDLNLRKALALLVYVAVTARPQSRDALATLIWPDYNQAEARGRLRRTLYRLRDVLGEAVVGASTDTISLYPGADLWLDCTDFLQHATSGLRKDGGAAISPEQAEHLQAAAALYTDDFLAGWTIADSAAFDEWLFFERERLRQLFAQVLERLVQTYGAQGAWDAAIPYARRWVALDPLHEPAQRYLITVYARAGQQAAAVRQYQECVRILDAELGVTPDAATTGLYEAIRSRQFPPREDDRPLSAEQAAMPFWPPWTDGAPRPHTAISARGGDDNTQVGTSARATRAVGREAELRRLHEHLEHALGGTRQIVFVVGEPGIGKTTLVNLFLDNMDEAGALWIGRGQCLEHRGGGEAYLPLLEALGRMCRGPDGQALIDLLADHAPTWLVQMPGLISDDHLAALQPKVLGTTRERMLREVVSLIEHLTAWRPLVLVLEDLHWSDYSTLDVLARVARQHEPARLLVIGTYRPADVQAMGHPLHDIARELQLRGNAAAIDLLLLTEAAVEHYLGTRFGVAAFPDGLARLLHRRTDGNPLFMVTVVDALIGQGLLQAVDGCWKLQAALDEVAVGVPETLRQLIELQIAQLDAGDQAILEAASVAGITFSAVEVAAGVEQEEEAVEMRCTALARQQQFLRERETGEWPDGTIAVRFEWSHHVIQQVLYDRVTAMRRARLHRQIGLRLEAGYGPAARTIAAELATHFVQGRDRRRAVHYLKLVGEQALSRSAHREAIEPLKLGLDLVQHWPDTPERTEHELALNAMLAPALIATQGWGSPEAEHAYLRARDLCTTLGGSRQRDQVLFGLATMWEFRAEYQQSA
ncbi:MAG: AAA family ATPase, partial [Chloroflexota bacterium]|nr:AAA family ATPase [Chloroflexota bacterium]